MEEENNYLNSDYPLHIQKKTACCRYEIKKEKGEFKFDDYKLTN